MQITGEKQKQDQTTHKLSFMQMESSRALFLGSLECPQIVGVFESVHLFNF